jgi:hypothetical protein
MTYKLPWRKSNDMAGLEAAQIAAEALEEASLQNTVRVMEQHIRDADHYANRYRNMYEQTLPAPSGRGTVMSAQEWANNQQAAQQLQNAWPTSTKNVWGTPNIAPGYAPSIGTAVREDLTHPVFDMDEATLADLWSARFGEVWVEEHQLKVQEDAQFWRLAHKRLSDTFRRLERIHLSNDGNTVWRLLPKSVGRV